MSKQHADVIQVKPKSICCTRWQLLSVWIDARGPYLPFGMLIKVGQVPRKGDHVQFSVKPFPSESMLVDMCRGLPTRYKRFLPQRRQIICLKKGMEWGRPTQALDITPLTSESTNILFAAPGRQNVEGLTLNRHPGSKTGQTAHYMPGKEFF